MSCLPTLRGRTLVVDNLDSFTWNLVHLLVAAGADEPIVLRPDAAREIVERGDHPDRLVISPGPKEPRRCRATLGITEKLIGQCPIWGVCLGMQCIASLFGMTVRRARRPMHGKTSIVRHDGNGIYAGLEEPFVAMRYHSLVVDGRASDELHVSARTDDGEAVIMGIRHHDLPVEGVQFHPESFLTPKGLHMARSFLQWA